MAMIKLNPKGETVHFEVENHGSIWLFRPLTDPAMDWVNENLPEDAMWFGDAVAIEHRLIGAIVEGAANDGLRVRVN